MNNIPPTRIDHRMRILKGAVITVVAAVIICVALYNLPYFAEQRAFAKTEEILASSGYWNYDMAVDSYFAKYPNGAHAQDVLLFAADAYRQQEQPLDAVKYVDRYLREYPDGKYTDRVTDIHNSIWNTETSRYYDASADKASDDGAAFMQALLRYMRDNRINTIAVKGNPTLSLKEYSEYPEHVRAALEYYYNNKSGLHSPFPSLRLPDDMETIKDKITPETAESYTSIIANSLQRGFNSVLTPDFIVFSEDADGADMPTVTVDYTVSTQESSYGSTAGPIIWEYKSGPVYMMVPQCYLLGIGMTFDATFSIPGSDISYSVHSKGDPGSESIYVNHSQAYTAMCARCTERFSLTIAADLGIIDPAQP